MGGGTQRVKKYRRRGGKVYLWNPWNFSAEVGDFMIRDGKLFKLAESLGWGKRCAGELTPKEIQPPNPEAKASYDPHNDEILWKWWA
jgi:hypothetical protein